MSKRPTHSRQFRWAAGLLLWLAMGAGLWLVGQSVASPSGQYNHVVPDLWQYATGPRPAVPLQFAEKVPLVVGDPIFATDDEGQLRQVGEIHSIDNSNGVNLRAAALLYPSYAQQQGFANQDSLPSLKLHYYETPNSLNWVAATLLPPEKRALIAKEIATAVETHRDEVLAALQPIAEASVRDSISVVEEDLPGVLDANRESLVELGAKYQDEIVKAELVPLAKEQLWPIVRERAQPVAEEVGLELWQKLSVWRFAWRYAYDSISFSDRQLTKEEWQRFVEDDAMPLLTERSPEFVEVVQQVMRDSAANPKVREVVRSNFGKLINDPELQSLAWDIIKQTVVDNPRIHDVMVKHWTSPEAKAAFQLASQRFEPTARRIGDLILGTPATGISPEFAQVLRHQVLAKDRRWLLAESVSPEELLVSGDQRALLVQRGHPTPPTPFVPSTAQISIPVAPPASPRE